MDEFDLMKMGEVNEPPPRRTSVIRRIISRVCSGGCRDGFPTDPLLSLYFRPLGLQGWCLCRDYYMDIADYHKSYSRIAAVHPDFRIRGRKHDWDVVGDDGQD